MERKRMIDVIVCTKGVRESLSVVLRCLESQQIIRKITIVSLQELDFIHSYKKCELVKEDKHSCLAWARVQGIKQCNSEYVAFVDDDVLLHNKHLVRLHEKLRMLRREYHCPIVIEGILINYSMSKLDHPRTPYQSKILQFGERGFTHNTLFLRETIHDWNPPFTHVYEDFHLTQFILKKGGLWYRYQQGVPSFHFSDHSEYSRKRWAFANARLRRLMNARMMFKDSLRNLIYGMRLTLTKNDVRFLLQKSLGIGGAIQGFYRYNRYVKL